MYIGIYIIYMCIMNEGIIKVINDYYGSTKGCRYWLSQETAHVHSTVEDLGWGCGYRNIQMMISCLLTHPLYSDHVMSGETVWVYSYLFYYIIGITQYIIIVFCGIPTILELQKTIEKAWKEGK